MSASTPATQHPLAGNNNPPTTQEARVIRASIKELEDNNSHLSRRLGFLRAQLDDKTAHLGFLKSIFAPIRLIPLEVLGEIFLRMPTSQLRPRNYQRHITRLLLVCKKWRDAARLTPALWCDIWVKADAPGLTYESLSAWAGCGGSMPKNLEISSSICGHIDRNNGRLLCNRKRCRFYNHALAKLLNHAGAEWRSVVLNCPTPTCLLRFIDSLHEVGAPAELNGWNSLQSFQMITSTWNGWVDRADHSPSWKAFSFIPGSITSFSLHLPIYLDDEDDHDDLLIDAQLEWPLQIPIKLLQGLTSLELRFDAPSIPASTVFTTLQHCENLETLEIELSSGVFTNDMDSFSVPQHFNRDGVSLLQLRRLRLCQVVGESMQDLKLIKFPNLVDLFISFGEDGFVDGSGNCETFGLDIEDDIHHHHHHHHPHPHHYHHHHHRDQHDVNPLADFIHGDRTSPSTLQNLHIKGASFLPGALRRVIRDLHSLTHLKLEWISLLGEAKNDFAELIEANPTPLRGLKTLEITRLKEPAEIPLLRAFAEARGIDLKLSPHDREGWEKDDKRYLYLAGLEYDSADDY